MSDEVTADRVAKLQLDPNAPDWASVPGRVKPAGSDGITVWELSPKKQWSSYRVAKRAPEVGDVAVVRGYPGGTYSQVRTRVKRLQTKSMWLEWKPGMGHGVSGGPVLNADDEVIGMITGGTGPEETPSRQYWHYGCIKWEMIRDAVAMADRQSPGPERLEAAEPPTVQFQSGRRRVVAFVAARGCTACEFFKRDLAAGHFRKFNIEVVTLNNGIWSSRPPRACGLKLRSLRRASRRRRSRPPRACGLKRESERRESECGFCHAPRGRVD